MTGGQRIHLCTTTADESTFSDPLRRWLLGEGYTLTSGNDLGLVEKLDAVRACDCCILLLNATFGQRDPLLSFADNELEAAAASDSQPGKLLIFALPGVDEPTSAEQQECIARWRNFTGGTFQAQCHTPEELLAQARTALAAWQQPAPNAPSAPLPVPSRAVMISSTGDLRAERETMRAAMIARGVPVIDYLHAASEAAAPIDRVTSWARDCQALFLILGPRYGYVSPADGLGVTELEFVTAWCAGRPIVVFQRADAATTSDPDQQQFIARVHALIPLTQIHTFTDVATLGQLVHVVLNVAPPPVAPPVAIDPAVAQRWYRRQTQRWLGRIPHLTQLAGMPLTNANFSLQPGQSGVQRGAAFAAQEDHRLQSISPGAVLERWPRFVLRGNPGAGKSTIMRWYAVSAPAQIVPIYLRLAAYARMRQLGQVDSLFAAMLEEEQRLALASPGASLWREALQNGHSIVLLDGLDEVLPAMMATITADILQLAQQLPDATRIVVSTRIAGYGNQLEPTFPAIDVLPLDAVQQQEVVGQWLGAAHPAEDEAARRARAQGILGILRASPRLAEWTRTPLLLTLFAALADAPHADMFLRTITPAEIYRRGLRLLLGRQRTWEQKASHWHLWAKEQVLLGLAQRGTLGGHGEVFTATDVQVAWERANVAAYDPAVAERLLRDLVEGDGVLLRLAANQYTFIHPTFQEYLAASLVGALPHQERWDLVARHRLNSAWDEMTPLLASELERIGHKEEADQVVQALMQGDKAVVSSAGIPDPLHYALQRAARCQGSRPARAHDAVGEQLVEQWRRIWRANEANAQRGTDTANQDRLSTTTLWGYLQMQAILALAQVGPTAALALPELTATLDAPFSTVRTFAELAIRYLADAGIESAQALLPRLAELQRQEAARRLSMQADATISELQQVLRSGDLRAQVYALHQLGRYGPSGAAALPDIIPLLQAPERDLRIMACGALGQIGAPAVRYWRDVLQVALHKGDSAEAHIEQGAVRVSATKALSILAAFTPEMVAELTVQLASPEPLAREVAAQVLCGSGAAAVPALPQLVRLALSDPDQNTRLRVAMSLKELRGLVVAYLPVVHQALQSTNTREQQAAVLVVKQLGPIAAPLVDDLRALLPSPNPLPNPLPKLDLSAYGRAAVASALGAIGPAAVVALPELRHALNESNPMRGAALEAIPGLGPQAAEALPEIRAILQQSWATLVAAGGVASVQPNGTNGNPVTAYHLTSSITTALQSLEKLGPAAAPAVSDIRAVIQSDPPTSDNTMGNLIWSYACMALRQIGHGAVLAVPDLLRVAQQAQSNNPRFMALYGLEQILPTIGDAGPVPAQSC